MRASVLEQHGTRLSALSPTSIVSAARADLKREQSKREGGVPRWLPYCFHRLHVRKATSAPELITLALQERERGTASGKRETRLIYGDEALLQAALAASRGGGA